MVHVCYQLTDKKGTYTKYVGTSMLSMFENTKSEVTVHLIHDNTLTEDNRDKLNLIANKYNQQIKFYNVEKSHAEVVAEYKKILSIDKIKRFSIGAAFRFFLHEVIPKDIDKIIHLDADTIVHMDIEELYNIELGEKPLGGIPSWQNHVHSELNVICLDGYVDGRKYFNTGVMLMNLDYFHKMDSEWWQSAIRFINDHPVYTRFNLNQTIFNYAFANQSLSLDGKFNKFIDMLRLRKINTVEPCLYHYRGHSIKWDFRDVYNRLYMGYFVKTPWFNVNMFDNISVGIIKSHDKHQTFRIQVTKILAGRERAFFTENCNVKPVRKTFLIADTEEIISTAADEDFEADLRKYFFGHDMEVTSGEAVGAIKKLLEAMKKSAGKKVYFLLVNEFYARLSSILKSEGFVENQDFVDGNLFRSASSGEPFDTHLLMDFI